MRYLDERGEGRCGGAVRFLLGFAVVAAVSVAAIGPGLAQSTGPSNSGGGHRSGGQNSPSGALVREDLGPGVFGTSERTDYWEDEPIVRRRPARRVIEVYEEDFVDDPVSRPPKVRVVKPTVPPPVIQMPSPAETRFVPGEVLVEMRGGGPIAPIARRLGLDVLTSLPVRLTGTTLHRVRSTDGRSTRDVLERLKKEGAVAFAQPNWLYTLQQAGASAPTTAARPETRALPGQYAADKLRLAGAHDRVRGRDVLVAVIDTAADATHPELVGAIEASFDGLEGVDPAPGLHGTAMAGAIASRLRLSGVAPGARLLVARAFGPPGASGVAQGSTMAVVKGLDWSVERGARVVSMSFAGPANPFIGRMIASARVKGVIAVAAAGNAGPQSPPLHPAAEPGVIAVTASDADDRVLSVANRGDHVTVTAPGVDILVPAPNGGYDVTTGTSVAAAEVSGVVALMLERRADLKPEDVRRILADTAHDLGAPGRDPIYGAGLVDATAAVARVR